MAGTNSAVQDDVAALNEALGLNEKAKEQVQEKPKDDQAPLAPLPTTMQLDIPLKNGIPSLPASMIRVEVGVYNKPTTKGNGFQSIGVAVVYFGLPQKQANGKVRFHPFAWIDHKLEVLADAQGNVQEIKIMGPFWTSAKETVTEDGEPDFYPAAIFNHRDRICRTIQAIMKAKKLRPIMDIWKERRGEKAIYSYELAAKESPDGRVELVD